jgi:hypothetical protein
MYIHITLGKWNDNAGLIECFINTPVQFMDKLAFVMGLVGPTQQFKIQR